MIGEAGFNDFGGRLGKHHAACVPYLGSVSIACFPNKDLNVAWSSDTLSEKPADIFIPDGSESPTGAVVFLHGYDGVTIRDNPAFSAELQQHRLACVCPHGPQCWWTDRLFEPFDVAISPIEYLAQQIPEYCRNRWGFESDRIGLTGVEMGGQGALQLAYRRARKFTIVAAISPKIDFETWYGHGTSLDQIFPNREAARQATATLHIHPLDWPKHQLLLCDPADHYCIDGVITLASKLSSTGIPFDSDFQTTHGGFGWAYANAMAATAIGYIASHMP